MIGALLVIGLIGFAAGFIIEVNRNKHEHTWLYRSPYQFTKQCSLCQFIQPLSDVEEKRLGDSLKPRILKKNHAQDRDLQRYLEGLL